MPTDDVEAMRPLIRAALHTREMHALEAVAFFAAASGIEESEFERVARDELMASPHEIHEWWQGPCNCDGHLN